jgi:HD-GYP domain-containing protein (c-di-GMP phosphodiesterase class II)
MGDLSERVPLQTIRDLLVVGQPLPFRILDAQGRLLLNAGHLLVDDTQYDSLIERGAWAERPAVEAERQARAAAASRVMSVHALSLFDKWTRLLWRLDKLARSLVRQQATAADVHAFLADLRALAAADPDVALFLCIRQDDRRFALYPLTHALHCATIALVSGKQLGWDDDMVLALAGAALTMNLPIIDLQAAMAEQGEPPTSKQLRDIRAHPVAAAELLRSVGIAEEAWLQAVTEHHEQDGGGGYPAALQKTGELARVLRAIDVFMAKISPRAHRPPMTPQTAVRQLFQQNAADPLTMSLIKTLGVHPPGSLVQLRSGEIAVVIRRPASGTQPIAATLSDTRGRPIAQTFRRDTAQPDHAVVGTPPVTTDFQRVLPERVYGSIAYP